MCLLVACKVVDPGWVTKENRDMLATLCARRPPTRLYICTNCSGDEWIVAILTQQNSCMAFGVRMPQYRVLSPTCVFPIISLPSYDACLVKSEGPLGRLPCSFPPQCRPATVLSTETVVKTGKCYPK